MQIKDKPSDPVAELHMVDAYIRWALMAVEEVVGKPGLKVVLRENDLERFSEDFLAEKFGVSSDITYQDYANLYRIGRLSTRYAIEKQGKLYNAYNAVTRAAVRVMPLEQQISTGLDNLINGFVKLWQEYSENAIVEKEDRSETFAYINANCAGKQADEPICHQTTGMLLGTFEWLTGKKIGLEQVACRAMGAEACVWEIDKTANE